jgi:hypothetical protein
MYVLRTLFYRFLLFDNLIFNNQYGVDDLKQVCMQKIKTVGNFQEESLLSAFVVAELLEDQELKEKCLSLVKRYN